MICAARWMVSWVPHACTALVIKSEAFMIDLSFEVGRRQRNTRANDGRSKLFGGEARRRRPDRLHYLRPRVWIAQQREA
jgi:hypothetical protein